jgi:hypothetical protein
MKTERETGMGTLKSLESSWFLMFCAYRKMQETPLFI